MAEVSEREFEIRAHHTRGVVADGWETVRLLLSIIDDLRQPPTQEPVAPATSERLAGLAAELREIAAEARRNREVYTAIKHRVLTETIRNLDRWATTAEQAAAILDGTSVEFCPPVPHQWIHYGRNVWTADKTFEGLGYRCASCQAQKTEDGGFTVGSEP